MVTLVDIFLAVRIATEADREGKRYGTNSRAIHLPSLFIIYDHQLAQFQNNWWIWTNWVENLCTPGILCNDPLIEIVHLTSPETKALAEKSRHTRHQSSTIVLENLQAFTKETSLFHGFNILWLLCLSLKCSKFNILSPTVRSWNESVVGRFETRTLIGCKRSSDSEDFVEKISSWSNFHLFTIQRINRIFILANFSPH